MKRILNPFVMLLSVSFVLLYLLAVWRLNLRMLPSFILAWPFVLVWLLPVMYWSGDRRVDRKLDHIIHIAGYLSMAFLSFFFVYFFLIEVLGPFISQDVKTYKDNLVFSLTLISMITGFITAKNGPKVREVVIKAPQLPANLNNLRIVQITDLHIGLTLRKNYVQKVVEKTLKLSPDLIVFTGDIVDGEPSKLMKDTAPLKALGDTKRAYLSLGNHDYYSGASAWIESFKTLGLRPLVNEHVVLKRGDSQIILAGVTDPAARAFDPKSYPSAEAALKTGDVIDPSKPQFKIVLAHNPKLAQMCEKAGFDLQLSGHTHAGQFIPWTLVVKFIHRPHYWGLSKQGQMAVYVGAGTGTWGPPIRFGTRPELTLIRLVSP